MFLGPTMVLSTAPAPPTYMCSMPQTWCGYGTSPCRAVPCVRRPPSGVVCCLRLRQHVHVLSPQALLRAFSTDPCGACSPLAQISGCLWGARHSVRGPLFLFLALGKWGCRPQTTLVSGDWPPGVSTQSPVIYWPLLLVGRLPAAVSEEWSPVGERHFQCSLLSCEQG